MVRPAMRKYQTDTRWFLEKLEAKGLTMFNLVGRWKGHNGVPMDYAGIHKRLHGERTITLDEARWLAHLLGESLEEVADRALGKKR
jgi:hypothetical protein